MLGILSNIRIMSNVFLTVNFKFTDISDHMTGYLSAFTVYGIPDQLFTHLVLASISFILFILLCYSGGGIYIYTDSLVSWETD